MADDRTPLKESEDLFHE